MADSFSFNTVDLSTYGLKLRSYETPFTQETPSAQMLDKAVGLQSLRRPIPFSLDIVVSAADKATLLSYLDSIKSTLNEREDCKLTLDSFTDRYWMVRFINMRGEIRTARAWEGTIDFVANDPAAYDNTQTSSDYTVDEDPETCVETVGGTEKVRPLYTLTCDSTLSDTTVIITNTATGEAIEWTGDLVDTDVLEINAEEFTVKLNDVDDMTEVDGQFPQLLTGSNTLTVEGFSGSFNIKYRKRYV